MKSLGPQEFADLASQLRQARVAEEPSLPPAERQSRWKELAGSLTDEEAEAMLAVIDQEFERVSDPPQ